MLQAAAVVDAAHSTPEKLLTPTAVNDISIKF